MAENLSRNRETQYLLISEIIKSKYSLIILFSSRCCCCFRDRSLPTSTDIFRKRIPILYCISLHKMRRIVFALALDPSRWRNNCRPQCSAFWGVCMMFFSNCLQWILRLYLRWPISTVYFSPRPFWPRPTMRERSWDKGSCRVEIWPRPLDRRRFGFERGHRPSSCRSLLPREPKKQNLKICLDEEKAPSVVRRTKTN